MSLVQLGTNLTRIASTKAVRYPSIAHSAKVKNCCLKTNPGSWALSYTSTCTNCGGPSELQPQPMKKRSVSMPKYALQCRKSQCPSCFRTVNRDVASTAKKFPAMLCSIKISHFPKCYALRLLVFSSRQDCRWMFHIVPKAIFGSPLW